MKTGWPRRQRALGPRGGREGQVVPLVALTVVVVGASTVVVGRLGGLAAARARVMTAADAAALAGAAEGREAAESMARANGATLVSYEVLGPDTRVQVRMEEVKATARARREGPLRSEPLVGARAVSRGRAARETGLSAAMRSALARAGQLLGGPVPVVSGYRSQTQQAGLYARRASNPYPVAPPGRSRHERGEAVDIPRSFVSRLLTVASAAGLCQPYPRADPIHFELCSRG